MTYHARQRSALPLKGDRLLSPDERAIDTKIQHALAPFDRVMREAEMRWGIDRLPGLVSPETAAKWGHAIGMLNEGITERDADKVLAWVGVCLRGLPHVEAEAVSLGAEKVPPRAMEWKEGGRHIVITDNTGDWPVIERLFPGAEVYAMRAVVAALDHYKGIVTEAKSHFPGAVVTRLHPPRDIVAPILDDDEIPF